MNGGFTRDLKPFFCRRKTIFFLKGVGGIVEYEFVLTPETEIVRGTALKNVSLTTRTKKDFGVVEVEKNLPLMLGFEYQIGIRSKELYITAINGRAIPKSVSNRIETTELCTEYIFLLVLFFGFCLSIILGIFLFFFDKRRKEKEQHISELLEKKRENLNISLKLKSKNS